MLIRHAGNDAAEHVEERALSEALSRVAAAVKKADPESALCEHGDASVSESLPGVRTPGAKLVLRFECTHSPCDSDDDQRVTTKVISKRSYEQGVRRACDMAALPLTHALLCAQALSLCDAAASACTSSQTTLAGSEIEGRLSSAFSKEGVKR